MSKSLFTHVRSLFVFLFFTTCFFTLSAQNLNKLEARLLESGSDAEKMLVYLEFANTYLPHQPDSAAIWVDKALDLNQEIAWTDYLIKTLTKLVDSYGVRSQLVERRKYYELAIADFSDHNNFKLYFKSLHELGEDFALEGRIDTAKQVLENAKMALDHFQTGEEPEYLSQLNSYHSGVGMVHAIGGELPVALRHFMISDSLSNVSGNAVAIMESQYMLGTTFLALGQFEKAIKVLSAVEQRHKNGNTDFEIVAVYSNLSSAYYGLDSSEIALSYLDKNLIEGRRIGDSITVGNVFINRGNIYNWLKEYDLADENYAKAEIVFKQANNTFLYNNTQLKRINNWLAHGVKYAEGLEKLKELTSYFKKMENLTELNESYKYVAQIQYALKQYKEAYESYQLYDSLNTALSKENYSDQVTQLETVYETSLHKRESEKQAGIALLEKQKNEEKNRLLIVIGSAAVLLLIILIAVIMLYSRLQQSRNLVNDQKEKIEKREMEKSILLKELHHRVKNNLQIVSSLLHLQSENVKETSAINAFKDGQNRVEAMAMIHHYLYSTDELTTLEVDKYFTQLVKSVTYSYGYQQDEVDLSLDITTKAIDVDLAIPLGLIANELISNSFKHAFKNVEKPMLKLALIMDENLTLIIADNGPGMGDKPLQSHNGSFGMDLIQSLTKQLKAELKYDQSNGSYFELIIPNSTLNKKN